MSRERIEWLRPFVSVVLVIFTLLVVVFFKMEVRRMGYAVWKKSRILDKNKEEHQRLAILAVKKLRPGRIHQIAQLQMDLTDKHSGQVIQMSQRKIALKLNR